MLFSRKVGKGRWVDGVEEDDGDKLQCHHCGKYFPADEIDEYSGLCPDCEEDAGA